jgi:hypothetical protein
MGLPPEIERLLRKGRRRILQLQALAILGTFILGPGILSLSWTEMGLDTPALWILRIFGLLVSLLCVGIVLETLGKLRNYRAIEQAIQEGWEQEISLSLDVAPFRGAILPKLRARLASGRQESYLLSEQEAAAILDEWRKRSLQG